MSKEGVVAEESINEEEGAANAAAAAEAAEMESGFSGAPTEVTPPAEAPNETDDEGAAPATPAAEEPEYHQITKAEYEQFQALAATVEELRTTSTAGLDKAFGKVGGLERTLKELQNATPKGYELDVTDDIVADLKQEFPEIGDLALKAFKTFASKLKGTGNAAVDAAQLEKMVDERASGRVIAVQLEALEDDHPKWRETVGLTDTGVNAEVPYRKWLATQPAEYQARLSSTFSAAVIGNSIKKFEAAQAAAEAEAKAAAEKKDPKPAPSTRQQRLAAAAVEKGKGGVAPGPTDDDEFEAGFKSG